MKVDVMLRITALLVLVCAIHTPSTYAKSLRERAEQCARTMKPISSECGVEYDRHLSFTLEVFVPPLKDTPHTGLKIHTDKIDDSLCLTFLSRRSLPFAIACDGRGVITSPRGSFDMLFAKKGLAFDITWTAKSPFLVTHRPEALRNSVYIDLGGLIVEAIEDMAADVRTMDDMGNRRLAIDRPGRNSITIEFALESSLGWYGIDRVFLQTPEKIGVLLTNLRRGCRRIDFGCSELTTNRKLLASKELERFPILETTIDSVRPILTPDFFVQICENEAASDSTLSIHRMMSSCFNSNTRQLIAEVDGFTESVTKIVSNANVTNRALDGIELALDIGLVSDVATHQRIPAKCDLVRYSRFSSADSALLILGGDRAKRLEKALQRIACDESLPPATAIRSIEVAARLGLMDGVNSILEWELLLRNCDSKIQKAWALSRGIMQFDNARGNIERALSSLDPELATLIAEQTAVSEKQLDAATCSALVRSCFDSDSVSHRRRLRAMAYLPNATAELLTALKRDEFSTIHLTALTSSGAIASRWPAEDAQAVVQYAELLAKRKDVTDDVFFACVSTLATSLNDKKALERIVESVVAGKPNAIVILMSLTSRKQVELIEAVGGHEEFLSHCNDEMKMALAACLRIKAARGEPTTDALLNFAKSLKHVAKDEKTISDCDEVIRILSNLN